MRKATVRDAQAIHRLVSIYAEKGVLLPRSLSDIYERIRDFWLVEENGEVVGVCALSVFWSDIAEIRSLAVAPEKVNRGIGRILVKKALEEAKELGVPKVFTLTYQVDFFRKLGFKVVDKETLPHKIWRDCINCVKFPNCDETAMEVEVVDDTEGTAGSDKEGHRRSNIRR